MDCEKEVTDIKTEMVIIVRDIEHLNRMCDKMDAYSQKYTAFLDMLIEEKREDREYRKMIRDRLTTGGVWAFVSFVCIAVFHEAKNWLK